MCLNRHTPMAFLFPNRSTQPGQLTGISLCLPRQNMKTRATGQSLSRDPPSSHVFQCLYMEVGYRIGYLSILSVASYKVCKVDFDKSVKLMPLINI